MARIPKAWRFVLAGLGVLAAVLMLATLAVRLLVDVDGYKPRVEAEASRALGVDVSIEGRLRDRQTTVSDLRFSVAATDGVFDFKPVTMRVFAGQVRQRAHGFLDHPRVARANPARTAPKRQRRTGPVRTEPHPTTDENRLALRGGLDFVDSEFDEVFVAVVDANGCAKVRQRISGPFEKPVVGKVSFITALAGPVQSLLGRAADLFSKTGVACEVFYGGSVAPPK